MPMNSLPAAESDLRVFTLTDPRASPVAESDKAQPAMIEARMRTNDMKFLVMGGRLKDVNHVKAELCWPDIVAMVFLEASFASAVEFIWTIGIAYAYFRLDVPVPRQNPLVAVGNAGSCEPTLVVTVLLLFRERSEGEFHVADVVFAAEEMHPEEVAVHGLARPIAEFRLRHPAFDTFSIREIPRVDGAEKLQRGVFPGSGLQPDVRGSGGPSQQVRF